jgi:hypothetical protein
MRLNFGFLEDYCSFHTSNTIRLNFSEFHQIFLNFPKIDRIGHLRIFLLRANFQTLLIAERYVNRPLEFIFVAWFGWE